MEKNRNHSTDLLCLNMFSDAGTWFHSDVLFSIYVVIDIKGISNTVDND